MSEEFDRAYWEERYRGHAAAGAATHHGQPNPHLVTEAADLTPGTALDAGCGEGAEARWLASRGWRVTAVDVSATALRLAHDHATALGADVSGRIEWVEADLTGWAPPEDSFDLVTTHYVHTAASGQALLRRLAAAVAPGGTLLIVGHHPSGPHHVSAPAAYLTAEEAAAALDPDRWDVLVAETGTRPAADHEGHDTTLRDTVLRARRRA